MVMLAAQPARSSAAPPVIGPGPAWLGRSAAPGGGIMPGDGACTVNRRRRSVASVVLLGALFALLGAVFLLSPPERNLADRAQVGAVITTALNAYYAEHGEYPPFLLGDTAPPFDLIPALLFCAAPDGQLYTPRITALYGPDPLLDGGYLRAYPRVSPQPRDPETRSVCEGDRLHGVRWQCSVFTPLGGRLSERGVRLCNFQGEDVTAQYAARRLFALGGVAHAMPDGTVLQDYGVSDQLGSNMRYVELTSFGYARGEWLGLTPQQAWLWFYYPREQSLLKHAGGVIRQATRGLDLLNGATGELIPDGIPDGVLLLYKLDAGQATLQRAPTEAQP
jgi:hypothetical protein